MRSTFPKLILVTCSLQIFAAPPSLSTRTLSHSCNPAVRVVVIRARLMPFMNFQQTRPWAKAIREAVRLKQMPPWFANNRAHPQYVNNPSLTGGEIATIEQWVAAGAPEGSLGDAPPPRKFVEGWNIGTPDMVVEMPQPYAIPASGTVEYTYSSFPAAFTRDTWVEAAEIRPGDRSTMHHAILFTRTPGSKWLAEYPSKIPFVPAPRPGKSKRSSDGDRLAEGSPADEWLVGYAPGTNPPALPKDTAYLVKAGIDFVLQLHYTPNGKATSDSTRIGLRFAKQQPAHRALVTAVSNTSFRIPPGDPNYHVKGSATLGSKVKLIAAAPHMHLRGKSMMLTSADPAGVRQGVIDIPRFDFRWQQMYSLVTPIELEKGSKLEMTPSFDNSRNNPNNPDPAAEVRWGDQTFEEMELAVVVLQIHPKQDLKALFERPEERAPANISAQRDRTE